MTEAQKPTDYAELLARLDNTDEKYVGAYPSRESCAVAIRSLIWERDDTEAERAHHDIMSQSLRVDLDLMRQRAETAEARAAEYEKALNEIAYKRCEYTTGEDHARAIWIARDALARKGEG